MLAWSNHSAPLISRSRFESANINSRSPLGSICTMPEAKHDDGDRPPYGEYQIDIYRNGILRGEPPILTTNPNGLEAQARKAMQPGPFNYIYGGAGEASTMDANRLAFRQWKIKPRVLRHTKPRDLKVNLFGQTYRECSSVCHMGGERREYRLK